MRQQVARPGVSDVTVVGMIFSMFLAPIPTSLFLSFKRMATTTEKTKP